MITPQILSLLQKQKTHSHLNVLLLEQGKSLGGNHTWSFHQQDVSETARDWLSPVLSQTWSEYEVAFPKFRRTIATSYASIRSDRFSEVLVRDLGAKVRLNAIVSQIEQSRVVLESGEEIKSRWVFDARGIAPIRNVLCGFQKFLGLDLKLESPHGLMTPILMDACVEQKEGYRFFYCLPWSETELLVEDTRYSLESNLNVSEMRDEIEKYCHRRGWLIEAVLREEKEALPLPFQLNFTQELPKKPSEGLPLGMRASLLHPTTGYSLPDAVRSVEYLTSLPESEWLTSWPKQIKKVQRKQKFFIRLNRVMFFSRKMSERYLFLQHFYRLPLSLMIRFYAGQLRWRDKVNFFLRRPPVSVSRAFQSVLRDRKSVV